MEILKAAINNHQLSFTKKCQLLSINRTTADYQLHHSKEAEQEDKDLEVKEIIDQIHLEFPYYGFRPMKAELERRGWSLNKKKVQRIMRKYGLLSQIKKLFKTLTNSQHQLAKYPNLIKELILNNINQVWGADITYVRLTKGFVYLAVIIDCFSRKIKGWAISKNLDHSLTIAALKDSLSKNPCPLIHHSDQGIQYCCSDYIKLLKKNHIQISMSDKANPFQNAICESFFKTLKYNEVYLNEYETLEEAAENIKHFIELVYNQKRLHSALGYLPPTEFEQKCIPDKPKQLFSEIPVKNEALVSPLSLI